MKSHQLIDEIRKRTDKQFVELFYEAAEGRHIYGSEREYTEAHLVLANAERYRENGDDWSDWTLQLLCPTPDQDWVDDAPIGQFGEHCGVNTASWSKNSRCPV